MVQDYFLDPLQGQWFESLDKLVSVGEEMSSNRVTVLSNRPAG